MFSSQSQCVGGGSALAVSPVAVSPVAEAAVAEPVSPVVVNPVAEAAVAELPQAVNIGTCPRDNAADKHRMLNRNTSCVSTEIDLSEEGCEPDFVEPVPVPEVQMIAQDPYGSGSRHDFRNVPLHNRPAGSSSDAIELSSNMGLDSDASDEDACRRLSSVAAVTGSSALPPPLGLPLCQLCNSMIESKAIRIYSLGVGIVMHLNCACQYWQGLGKDIPAFDWRTYSEAVLDAMHPTRGSTQVTDASGDQCDAEEAADEAAHEGCQPEMLRSADEAAYEGCQPEMSLLPARASGSKRRKLYAAVAEERGLAPDIVEGVVEAVMRRTCDNVKMYGLCELGGPVKLTLKIEEYGDDVFPAAGTWIIEEETNEDACAEPVLPTASPIVIHGSLEGLEGPSTLTS